MCLDQAEDIYGKAGPQDEPVESVTSTNERKHFFQFWGDVAKETDTAPGEQSS